MPPGMESSDALVSKPLRFEGDVGGEEVQMRIYEFLNHFGLRETSVSWAIRLKMNPFLNHFGLRETF